MVPFIDWVSWPRFVVLVNDIFMLFSTYKSLLNPNELCPTFMERTCLEIQECKRERRR